MMDRQNRMDRKNGDRKYRMDPLIPLINPIQPILDPSDTSDTSDPTPKEILPINLTTIVVRQSKRQGSGQVGNLSYDW